MFVRVCDIIIYVYIMIVSELLEQRKARGITREEMNQALMLVLYSFT